ncbi:HAMP domain-containing histidine kinase [Sphingomonas sp. R-74633]|uniref:sensor histidine kinase n=1 Tax=Sphingomonas sp. R-74633 TaxID=2751188 RepID=UPI0015D2E9FE|nr:HAMP domain-containing sensor histidine kinase [Sphingomonas sp. R-74633]NYT39873.1 HAMP domain-containing histidine kinase [Sphingomonas sp. R-74633]
MNRIVPRSLPGQIALLVAVALFVAQAINFGLLVRERQGARFAQVIVPTVTRLIDGAERLGTPVNPRADTPAGVDRRDGQGGGRGDGRRQNRGGRVDFVPANPIPAELARRPDVENDLRRGLTDGGVQVGQVIAVVHPIDANRPLLKRMDPARADRLRRMGAELIVAVELPGKGWLSLSSAWPRSERNLIWQLFAQTLILYIVVLLPVLWAGHRIARPLRKLAEATRAFHPNDNADPVEESGPSDVRAVIAAYNSLSTRVTAMLDEKDRMLGAIGHDLRTPLAALRVRIESVDDDEDRARMADTIDEMNHTLDDILSLARLGRPSEPATDVDLSALIDAVVEDFRDLDQDVTFEEAPRLRMHLRPSLMRRAVRNLIENAIKYGGATEVRLRSDDRNVRIEVCDRGPGIPQDKLEKVFDPFTRLEESRNRETGGAGLGLALARAIVRDASGEITLVNREGGGLVATITLPRS